MTIDNNHLSMVYNNNETITGAGFTMQSNYLLPVLSRMVDENMINFSAQTVVQTILSYKHTEENPFPSRDEIANRLGKSISYVRKALKSITDSGILLIEKAGRRNTYNFKPLFNMVEKFISEFVHNKNKDITISELMNNDIHKSNNEDVQEGEISPPEEDEAIEDVSIVELPEMLTTLLKSNNIGIEGVQVVENKYSIYKESIDDRVFAEKIVASSNKKNFIAFFNKCIDNAYINNEQPTTHIGNSNTPIRNDEVIPDWFDELKNGVNQDIIDNSVESDINYVWNSSVSELNKNYADYKDMYDMLNSVGNVHSKNSSLLELMTAKINNPDITHHELVDIELKYLESMNKDGAVNE